MFRKKLTRWSKHEDDSKPPCAFTEPFWQYYVDSLVRQQGHEQSHSTPINTRKYSASSSSVSQLKALFGPDLPQPSTYQAISALKSPFSGGDIIKAYHFIRYFQISECGFFITNNGVERSGAEIQLVGAENWENVLCYFDSLIFSMFANLDSFEPILFILNQHADPLVTQLLGLLRVYVNLMRLGNLITTDITQRICECLMKLGFNEALSHRQQDAAPLFEFLTETLAMPLLTFRVEIQHHGKHDEDDTKYSKERILFVSVPDDDEGEPVKPSQEHVELNNQEDNSILLEECLEHYFNNSISVKRELQRRATLDSLKLGEDVPAALGSLVSVTRPRSNSGLASSRVPETPDSQKDEKAPRKRASTLSIWSISSFESKPREVMLPAWMLLRLLPFYTDDNNEGIVRNSKEFANRRPVVPICLKRYSFSAANQHASRSKKKIIIPPVIDLPLFVADDQESEELMGGFKLILESAVCHRGTTIESGHFISAIRKNAQSDESEPTLDSPWYLYDDMKTQKVVTKTFQQIFDKEWPYMLFYRLVSTDDMDSSSKSAQAMKSFSSSVSAPKGSKARYWSDEPLSRIASVSSFSENDGKASLHSEVANNLSSSASSGTFSSSVPIPDVLPGNPKFVDIRGRYLWYVTDSEKNYYKESASLSKSGSRNVSISFTPQFRRNSQWSDVSNICGLSLHANSVSQSKGLEKPQIRQTSHLLSEAHVTANEDHNVNSGEEHESEETSFSSKQLNTPTSEQSNLHSHHLHGIFSREKEVYVLSSKAHHWKRRSDYKKEKCVIV